MKQTILSILDALHKLSHMLSSRQKKMSAVVFVLIVLGSLAETAGVSAILPLVTAILTPEKLLHQPVYIRIADLFHLSEPNQVIYLLAIGTVVLYTLICLYLIFVSYARARYAGNIKKELSVYMMNCYLQRGYPFFLENNPNVLYRGVTGDINGVYGEIYEGFRVLAEGITVLSIAVLLFVTNALMSLCLLAVAGLCLLLVFLVSKRKMHELGEKSRQYETESRKWASQTFHGVKEVMVMHKQDYFAGRFADSSDDLRRINITQTVASESPSYIFEAVCVAGVVAAVCIVLSAGMNSAEFVPVMATMVVAVFRIMPSLGRISNSINIMLFDMPSMNAAYKNFTAAEQYVKETRERVREDDGEQKLSFTDSLELRDVCWRYDHTDRDVLKHLNLTIHKDESVAFVGESGSGKSTAADILLGLLHPSEGGVFMDGIDILTIPGSWSRIIGYVPQFVYILDDTIRNNVAFGVPQEEIDDDRVWDALRRARLETYVRSLPDGLETTLGDQGVRFSGGQRQRIAIARALYYDPEILIFDEATSALDNQTENEVMDAINGLQGSKTLIIVAHRLSTIRNCDRVYEIRDGIAVERDKKEILSGIGA